MEFRFRAKSGNKTFDEPSHGLKPPTSQICSHPKDPGLS